MPIEEPTEQLSLEFEDLRRALRWERLQKARLLEALGVCRQENQRLSDEVHVLQVEIEALRHQRSLF